MTTLVGFSMNECNVGYIVRGKPSRYRANVLPLDEPIHADCILPNGSIAGYAYDDESYYNGNRLSQYKLKGLEGKISLNEEVLPHYRDVEKAVRYKVLSSILVIKVSRYEANIFYNYWKELFESMPKYNRAFNNCATICYGAFKKAGLLSGMIPPVTPNKLHSAILKKFGNQEHYKLINKTGFFGVEKNVSNQNINDIVIASSSW